jgi:hypothetical protein
MQRHPSPIKTKLDAATARLSEAEEALNAAMNALSGETEGEKTFIASALAGTFERMHDAKREVRELTLLLDKEPLESTMALTTSAAQTRPCPACANTIMAAATLCGYCWTRFG